MANNIRKQNQIDILNELFTKMNAHFFKSSLPDPLITLVRHKGAKGYFLAESFKHKDEDGYTHEIAMNPELFNYDDKIIGSTLLHEMVHLWQEENGTPGSNNYHNKEFAKKMLEVGLQTYDVKTGKETGTSVTHKIIENGEYSIFYDNKINSKLVYIKSDPIELKKRKSKTTTKTTYRCPNCKETVVWGKPNMILICGICKMELEEK